MLDQITQGMRESVWENWFPEGDRNYLALLVIAVLVASYPFRLSG